MHSFAPSNIPVLEKLTLELSEAPDNWMEMEGSYNLTEQPFSSNQLKVVEVKCEKFDGRVYKILMMNSYGIYIEHIIIQQSVRSSEGWLLTLVPSRPPTSVLMINDNHGGPTEPTDIPQARTQHISPSENAHMWTMIDHIVA